MRPLPGLLHPALSAPKGRPRCQVRPEQAILRFRAPPLAPSSCGCPGGAQAQAQAGQAAGHHLLPGRSCQAHLVLPHLAGIIMPQLIFQRLRLSPLSFPLVGGSGFNQGLVTTSPGPSLLWRSDRAAAGQPRRPWLLVGAPWKLQCDCSSGYLTRSRMGEPSPPGVTRLSGGSQGCPGGLRWKEVGSRLLPPSAPVTAGQQLPHGLDKPSFPSSFPEENGRPGISPSRLSLGFLDGSATPCGEGVVFPL